MLVREGQAAKLADWDPVAASFAVLILKPARIAAETRGSIVHSPAIYIHARESLNRTESRMIFASAKPTS